MADIQGKWRIGFIPDFDENGIKFIPRSEAEKSKDIDKDLKFMLKATYVITENKMSIQIPLKGKEKEEAIEEGMEEVEPGVFEVEAAEIINKKGKYYFEMGEEDGKPHYEPLALDKEGHLDYMLFKLERI